MVPSSPQAPTQARAARPHRLGPPRMQTHSRGGKATLCMLPPFAHALTLHRKHTTVLIATHRLRCRCGAAPRRSRRGGRGACPSPPPARPAPGEAQEHSAPRRFSNACRPERGADWRAVLSKRQAEAGPRRSRHRAGAQRTADITAGGLGTSASTPSWLAHQSKRLTCRISSVVSLSEALRQRGERARAGGRVGGRQGGTAGRAARTPTHHRSQGRPARCTALAATQTGPLPF